MQEYYFDTLPLHPQPERLESLTSYLIRLAEANSHSDRDTFALFFSLFGIVTLADYPSALFNILRTLAQCSETRLLGTTFYHVGRKFGRSSLPQPLAQFLQGTVAQSLRYCPMCLADYGYHFLPWRFLPLKGCDKHSCELLNECGHCGGKMPIFGPVLKMAICPICKGDLRKCLSSPLEEEEKQRAFIFTQMLEFLLSPQPWEDEYPSIAEMIGRELKILRQGQRKTQIKVSQAIGCPKWKLQALAHGSVIFREV
jgi:TniQ